MIYPHSLVQMHTSPNTRARNSNNTHKPTTHRQTNIPTMQSQTPITFSRRQILPASALSTVGSKLLLSAASFPRQCKSYLPLPTGTRKPTLACKNSHFLSCIMEIDHCDSDIRIGEFVGSRNAQEAAKRL